MYFITYRLKDSIYQEKFKTYNFSDFKNLNRNQFQSAFIKYDSIFDVLHNDIKYLKEPDILEICKSSLHFYDKKEFDLYCYCIMPNHIHLVFNLFDSTVRNVGEIMNSIKKYSAKKSNEILNRKGAFWQAESFDRLVRDDVELYFIIRYVLLNPVNAGLVKDWRDWKGTYCTSSCVIID